MKREKLKAMVGDEVWKTASSKLRSTETVKVLHSLFDHIIDALETRIDDIKTVKGQAIQFFSGGREFLTINVCRDNLRIYIHPPAGALFDPDAHFSVEKFRFWEGSFLKTSGKYRSMSAWVSEITHLTGMKEIIKHIPKVVD